jgi:hypothetical protein
MTFRDVFIKVSKQQGWDDARIERAMKSASLNMPVPPEMELSAEAAAMAEERMIQMHAWAAHATPREVQAQLDLLAKPHVAKN